jgi:uncharacterized protein (TIGR03435 family)
MLSPCLLGIVSAIAVAAQALTFEAASIKPSPAADARPRLAGGPGTANPGQITYTNVTLASVLVRAYAVKAFQISGPDWLTSRRYDIAAKIPSETTPEQFRTALQNLLAERFRLELHRETRPIPGYELVIGRSGTKLKSPADGGEPKLEFMERIKGKAVVSSITAHAQPLGALTDLLTREFQMPILDKTVLSNLYDFQLEFAPQRPGALPPVPAVDGTTDLADDSAANLLTAVQQQLGLRLVPAKVPVEIVVIDRGDPLPLGN